MYQQQERSRLTNVNTDGNGNQLKVYESTGGKILELKLVLNGEDRERFIGSIDRYNRNFVAIRNRGKHLHAASRSYGFNYYVLSMAKTFDYILLSDDFGTYRIPVTVALQEGQFLYFKSQGFEKQIFISLDTIANYKQQSNF